MKKIIYTNVVITILIIFFSCESDFLEKPMGSDINQDSIFSTRQKSLAAISQAYSMSLSSGINLLGWDNNRVHGLRSGTLSHISGELNAVKFNWEDGWIIQRSGLTADDGSGIPRSTDGFAFNYQAIRHNNLIIENIDNVADMSQEEKEQVKGEMKTLNAYIYQEMFKRYGGVPIVTTSLSSSGENNIPRATLQETLEHIISLCDEAVQVLPDRYIRTEQGRITEGVALAVKAEALIYAARPLFNSAIPYLDYGTNSNLICFGNADPTRWQRAADAADDVIKWAESNGYKIINTGSPLDDYGNAVATPNNPEMLLAYRYAGGPYNPHDQSGGANSMSYTQLSQYVKADGTEQTWAGSNPTPYSEYLTKVNEMEPRYKASAMAAGIDAWNNPNDVHWSSPVVSNSSNWEGRGGTEGCGRRVKFWYHAGTRDWFEFPIYRLAEFYLDAAEAYNELGNASLALEYLNVIRNRAGLPSIVETNQVKLRQLIQREWAVEFYEENHRLFDVKHWKLPDIDKGIIGGEKKGFAFTYVNGQYGLVASDYLTYSTKVMYTGFWNPNQYLEPLPIAEINKGYLIQNPGY
jgi:hypothetical protein